MAPDQDTPMTFAEMLRTIGQGRFGVEATEALTTLVKEMTRIGETNAKPKGQLVVTVKFTLDRGVMEIDPSIMVKAPATVRARTIMYPSADGRLSRNDTRQGTLALEATDVSTAGVRDIRSATAPSTSH